MDAVRNYILRCCVGAGLLLLAVIFSVPFIFLLAPFLGIPVEGGDGVALERFQYALYALSVIGSILFAFSVPIGKTAWTTSWSSYITAVVSACFVMPTTILAFFWVLHLVGFGN